MPPGVSAFDPVQNHDGVLDSEVSPYQGFKTVMVSEDGRQANGVERSHEPQERYRHAVYFLFGASI